MRTDRRIATSCLLGALLAGTLLLGACGNGIATGGAGSGGREEPVSNTDGDRPKQNQAGRFGTIEGTITDADGVPQAECAVSVEVEPSSPQHPEVAEVAAVSTGEGHYRRAMLGPAVYRVVAYCNTGPERDVRLVAERRRVTVTAGQTTRADLIAR